MQVHPGCTWFLVLSLWNVSLHAQQAQCTQRECEMLSRFIQAQENLSGICNCPETPETVSKWPNSFCPHKKSTATLKRGGRWLTEVKIYGRECQSWQVWVLLKKTPTNKRKQSWRLHLACVYCGWGRRKEIRKQSSQTPNLQASESPSTILLFWPQKLI